MCSITLLHLLLLLLVLPICIVKLLLLLLLQYLVSADKAASSRCSSSVLLPVGWPSRQRMLQHLQHIQHATDMTLLASPMCAGHVIDYVKLISVQNGVCKQVKQVNVYKLCVAVIVSDGCIPATTEREHAQLV
jgi:hypothetical protein